MSTDRRRTPGSSEIDIAAGMDRIRAAENTSAIESVLNGLRETFSCRSATIHVAAGAGLISLLSVPDASSSGETIPFESEHPVAACARVRDIVFVQGSPESGPWSDMFALPLVSSEATIGVLSLERPLRGREQLASLSRIIAMALTPLLRDEGARAARRFNTPDVIMKTVRNSSPYESTTERLRTLTTTLMNSFALTSVRLYSESDGSPELLLSAGDDIAVEAYVDIEGPLKKGIHAASLRHDPDRRCTMSRNIVPIDSPDEGRIVVVYEMDAARRDTDGVRENVSCAYLALLALAGTENTVSLNWVRAIETMEKVADDVSRSGDDYQGLVLERFLDRLSEMGFIAGYDILPGSEIAGTSTRGDSDGNGHQINSELAMLMSESSETKQPLFDKHASTVVFPVKDDANDTWEIALRLTGRQLLRSERRLWERLGSAFGLLVRGFMLEAKSRRQAEETRKLRSSLSAFQGASASMETADTAGKVVTRLAESLSTITLGEAFGLVKDGDAFTPVLPADDTIRIESAVVESMLSSSIEVAGHVYDVHPDALRGRLPELVGSEVYHGLYAVTISSREGEARGLVLCPGQKSRFLPVTREGELSGLASLADVRMSCISLAEEASLERKKLRKFEELISKISLSEADSHIMASIVEAASVITNSEMSALAILDVEKGRLVSANSNGFDLTDEVRKRWSSGGVTGRILRTLEAEIINDYAFDPDRDSYSIDSLKVRQLAGVPIRIDVKHKGFLVVMNTADGMYSVAHLRTLELLSNIASSAIRAANARDERRRLVSDFDKLQSAELKLYSSRSFSELIELLANEARDIFHASAVLIATDVNNVKRILFSTTQDVAEGDVVYNSGPIGLQFDEQPHTARIVERATLEEEWAKVLETNELLLVRSGLPHNSIVVATVNAEGKAKYATEDIDNFSKLSKIASTALEKTVLLSGINQKLKHIEIMHTIVDALVYGKKEYEIYDSVLPTLVEMCRADLGLLWKYDREGEKLKVSAEWYRSRETEHLVGYEVGANKGIVGSVVMNKMPVLIANAAIDNKAVHISGTNVEKFESVLGMPLIVSGKLLGVLTVYRDQPPPFTSSELDMLSGVSNDISLVMARHSLEADGKKHAGLPGTD